MKRKAAERNCAIAGSVAVCENGNYYNRFTLSIRTEPCSIMIRNICSPLGRTQAFHCRHRACGGELPWGTYSLEVCYDLRFPVWSRNLGDYDMILYVASWPTPRVDAWSALLRARAIENQCYVAGVNRMGTDPTCEYSGGSAIIDPYGKR